MTLVGSSNNRYPGNKSKSVVATKTEVREENYAILIEDTNPMNQML
jgi:hypothetical protein